MPGDKRVVVVTRTFSKLHGLAGLRIGYLAGPRDVVATLRKVRPPFSVNAMAESAALAALADRDHRARVREQTLAARNATAAMLEDPAPANPRPTRGRSRAAPASQQETRRQVRPVASPPHARPVDRLAGFRASLPNRDSVS